MSLFQHYSTPRCRLRALEDNKGIRFTSNLDGQFSVTNDINDRFSEYEWLLKGRVLYRVLTLRS